MEIEGEEGLDIRIIQLLSDCNQFSVHDVIIAINEVQKALDRKRHVAQEKCQTAVLKDIENMALKQGDFNEDGSARHFFNKHYKVRVPEIANPDVTKLLRGRKKNTACVNWQYSYKDDRKKNYKNKIEIDES